MAIEGENRGQGQPTSDERWGFLRRLVILSAVLAVIFLLAAITAYSAGGIAWLASTTLAFAACFLGAVLAHLVGEFPRGDLFLTSRLLGSSLVRVGVPVILLVVLKFNESPMLDRGMVYFVILFYLVGLVMDLVLHIKRFQFVMALSNNRVGSTMGSKS